MRSRERKPSIRGFLCGVLIALLAASGCASTERGLKQENRLKQAKSHFEIGVDQLQRGQYAASLREFLAAESLDPKNPKIHAGLAEAYLHRGRAAESEAHLLRALEILPEYHDARLNLSALYLNTGRYEEAAEQARVLVDDPTFPEVWRALTNLAVAEIGQGSNAEARGHLELALEYNRKYWPALLTLGILEHLENRPLQAIVYFERALAQKPRPSARAEANYRMAEVYVSLGRRKKAVDHLMTAVAQTPDGEWGRKSEQYLESLR